MLLGREQRVGRRAGETAKTLPAGGNSHAIRKQKPGHNCAPARGGWSISSQGWRSGALPRWLLSERSGLTGQGQVGYNMEAGREQQAVSRGSGSGVEHLLAKEKVAGSNPVSRSRRRRGQVVKARVCKTLITGSNPVVASQTEQVPNLPALTHEGGCVLSSLSGGLDPCTERFQTLMEV